MSPPTVSGGLDPAGTDARRLRASDDDWALLARADERDAMATLFARHRDYVFRLAWSTTDPALAEDVVQDVFLRLARGFRRWRPRAAFRTWLFRVVRNTARELARKERRGRRLEPDQAGDQSVGSVAPWDPRCADLAAAIHALPERQRQVVVLRHLEGFTTAETARAMRCRPGTVKAHLHHALGTLRKHLADPPDPPYS